MVNIRTLGLFLDTLKSGEDSVLATRPAAPVSRSVPVARVARDASQAPIAPPADGTAAANTRAANAPASTIVDLRADVANAPQRSNAGQAAALLAVVNDSPGDNESASLDLSPAAQWLQRSLLPSPAQRQPATIRTFAPLTAAAPDGPDEVTVLAGALRASVAQSGLFYESHLAEWTMQRYAEIDLWREPQAMLAGGNTTQPGASTVQDPADGLRSMLLPGGDANAAGGQTGVELLRAQLQALESRQFLWRGKVWPGQTAAMVIAEEDQSSTTDAEPAWRTHLTLNLPSLGQIDIELRVDGSTLRVGLAGWTPESVDLMRAARADLVAALDSDSHKVAAVGIRQS